MGVSKFYVNKNTTKTLFLLDHEQAQFILWHAFIRWIEIIILTCILLNMCFLQ